MFIYINLDKNNPNPKLFTKIQYLQQSHRQDEKNNMKRTTLILSLVIATISLLAQQHTTFYHQRASLFKHLETTPNDIIFIGNSLTNGAEWSELFNNKNIKNRGISGDICMGVYDRLDVITKGKPAQIFLLIGINDMGRGASIDSVVVGINKIIDKIAYQSPTTEIYLQSILPLNDSFDMFNGHTKRWSEIKPLNKQLEALTKNKQQVTYIDLYSHFVEPGTHKLNPRFTNDGLHLLGEGYMKWVEIVAPYINRGN